MMDVLFLLFSDANMCLIIAPWGQHQFSFEWTFPHALLGNSDGRYISRPD